MKKKKKNSKGFRCGSSLYLNIFHALNIIRFRYHVRASLQIFLNIFNFLDVNQKQNVACILGDMILLMELLYQLTWIETVVSVNWTPSDTRIANMYTSLVSRSSVSFSRRMPVSLFSRNFRSSPEINVYDRVPMVSGSVARIVAIA